MFGKLKEKMKDYKIKKKLMISYVIIMVLFVIAVLVSIVNLVLIGDKVETFYKGPFTTSARANVVNERFEGVQKAVYRSISNSDQKIIDDAISEIEAADVLIDEQIPIIKERFLGDKSIVESIEKELEELDPMID